MSDLCCSRLVPPEFAKTGVFVRPGAVPPRRVQVVGERNSGTNFVKRLLGRNTGLVPSDGLGWKHGPVQAVAIPADLLVVICVRRADDWVRSMFRRPWHATKDLQRASFEDFLRRPWCSVADRARYFPGLDPQAVGRPLQLDRDPMTGAVPPDLPSLRRMKLAAHVSVLQRDCTVALVRLEAVAADPDQTVRTILQALELPAPKPFRPVHRRLGMKFKPAIPHRPDPPDQLCQEDLAFLRARLDLPTEAALGYTY